MSAREIEGAPPAKIWERRNLLPAPGSGRSKASNASYYGTAAPGPALPAKSGCHSERRARPPGAEPAPARLPHPARVPSHTRSSRARAHLHTHDCGALGGNLLRRVACHRVGTGGWGLGRLCMQLGFGFRRRKIRIFKSFHGPSRAPLWLSPNSPPPHIREQSLSIAGYGHQPKHKQKQCLCSPPPHPSF